MEIKSHKVILKMMEYGNDNLDMFGDELPGEFYLIKTVQMDFFGIMTKAAI